MIDFVEYCKIEEREIYYNIMSKLIESQVERKKLTKFHKDIQIGQCRRRTYFLNKILIV